MKKKLIILGVVAVLIIAFLVGVSLTKKKNLEEEYLSIFENRKFILDGKKKTIKDLMPRDDDKVEFYSFVDYGNDSHKEMFVTINGLELISYVFNYQGNKMYAYKLDENVISNTEDGYSSISGNNGGWVKYTFDKKKVSKEKVIYISYNENKCEYKNEVVECSKIVDKEIEFLNSIKSLAEELEYTE